MASPTRKQVAGSNSIPIKKVLINDHSDLPSHYSSTPGGTLYSTTPGGTRIVYEKSLLLHLRNSPISKTPPKFDIPEHLIIGSPNRSSNYKNTGGSHKHHNPTSNPKKRNEHDEQFQIEL